MLRHSQLRCECPPTEVRMGYLIRRYNYALQRLRKSNILYHKSLVEAMAFELNLQIIQEVGKEHYSSALAPVIIAPLGHVHNLQNRRVSSAWTKK